MLGVPRWGVDRFLQIVACMNMAEEELRDPLVLLVSTWGAPSKVGFAISQSHGRGEGRTWALPRGKASGVLFIHSEHLGARPERPAETGNGGRALQPASTRRRRDEVAEAIGDVDVAVQMIDADLATLHAECLAEYAKALDGLGEGPRAAALLERAGCVHLLTSDAR